MAWRGGGEEVWDSPPTSGCYLGVNIPKSVWSTSLMLVLAKAANTKNYELCEPSPSFFELSRLCATAAEAAALAR